MSWLPESAAGAASMDRVFGLRPELYEDYRAFAAVLRTHSGLSPELLELSRLRVAQLLGAGAELHSRAPDAPPEEKVARLEDCARDAIFTPVESACLGFAEKFVLDPRGATDAEAARLVDALSPAGMVGFVEALALFDGFTRFRLILGVADGEGASPPRALDRASRRAPASGAAPPRPRVPRPAGSGEDAIAGSVLAHQPELLRAFLRLYGTLWSHGVLDHPAKEVARLRNARITGCTYCKNVRFAEARRQGLGEELVDLIDDDFAESRLDERLKAVIRFADVFLVDPASIRADVRTEILRHLTSAQVVELAAGLALFMGFSKIAIVLGQEPTEMPVTVIPTPERPAGT